ncbi:hypothetical protein QQS21_004784 [Conoideocrella luteorostrata]|uniref:Uncharacterized protein n=1 Tax=Conoideocrella luteorostrata TaxID=1105319 RepID=A0AAJ0FV41_9HYPO|nr:hypothetical protein QQS21_004784 [Conoideocrella luteorostrata]
MEVSEEPRFDYTWAMADMMLYPSNVMPDVEFDTSQDSIGTEFEYVFTQPDWQDYSAVYPEAGNGTFAVDTSFVATDVVESSGEELCALGSDSDFFQVSTEFAMDGLIPSSCVEFGPLDYFINTSMQPAALSSPAHLGLVSATDAVQFSPAQAHPGPAPVAYMHPYLSAYSADLGKTYPTEDAVQCVTELHDSNNLTFAETLASGDGTGLSHETVTDRDESNHVDDVSLPSDRSMRPSAANRSQEGAETNSPSEDAVQTETNGQPRRALPRRIYNLRKLPTRSNSKDKPRKKPRRIGLTKVADRSDTSLETIIVAGPNEDEVATEPSLLSLDGWSSLMIDVSKHVPRAWARSGHDPLSRLLRNIEGLVRDSKKRTSKLGSHPLGKSYVARRGKKLRK